jgi:hypothetical protein
MRDAQAEQRCLDAGGDADERRAEGRAQPVLEETALVAQRTRLHDLGRVHSTKARCRRAGADAHAQQAGAIDVAVEYGDAAVAREVARLPVASRRRIEVRRDVPVKGGCVCGRAMASEEPGDGRRRQVRERR